MLIVLKLADKILEARVVSERNLDIGGYLEGLKNDMIEANEDTLDLSGEEPIFTIMPFPTKKPDIN
jgi:hypothetical protein